MPRTLQEILDHADELADYFESSEPDDWSDVPVEVEAERRLVRAARARADIEREIATDVTFARAHGVSWARIGRTLGTSAQATQKRYGSALARSVDRQARVVQRQQRAAKRQARSKA